MVYLVSNLKYLVIALVDFGISYKLINLFNINSIMSWFLVFGLFTILNGLVVLVVFYIIGELRSLSRIKYLITRGA